MVKSAQGASVHSKMHFFYLLIGYFGYYMSTFLCVLLGGPIISILLVTGIVKPQSISAFFTWYCHFLTQAYLPYLKFYRIVNICRDNQTRVTKPAIYVANHRGKLDGPLLLGIIPECAVIIKQKYANLPLYSYFVKHLNFIGVSPHSVANLSRAHNACKKALENGHNLLIFPEGARSSTIKMLTFKDFAFRIAKEMNLPVIPVVIHTDIPFMTKSMNSIFPKKTINCNILFYPPCFSNATESPGAFADRIRKQIASCLQTLDNSARKE